MSAAQDNGPIAQTDPPGNTSAGDATSTSGVAATNAQVGAVEATSDYGPFYTDPTFWTGVGFLLFVAVLFYLKVHRSAAAALDARGAKIRTDLDEAARLRREAEALLAAAEARLGDSAAEAKSIVDAANRNAAEIADDSARDLDLLIERRTRAAEDRIAAAQRSAEAALRARAVDLATEQARRLLAQADDAALQDRLTGAAIAELDRRLH